MTNLRLGTLLDDRPVRLTVELPAALHRDLVAYAKLMQKDGSPAVEPAKLVGPMLERFMRADRAFAKAKRQKPQNGTI